MTDILVQGGTLIDGTGASRRRADVHLAHGLVAAVGENLPVPPGAEKIDADGLLVTPGFVDLHTHYDGQAIWDSRLQPSSLHGVTTAVMGNCGVGFAPVHPGDHDRLVALMEGVEDIPAPCLNEGLDWAWESFADYLTALERRPHDVDLCALLPHAAVRVYVMGERALALENANQGDIASMRAIAADAVRAGAFGFSTSRTISHKTLAGDPTPTLRAQEDELTGIAMGLRDAGGGLLEVVSDWNSPDAATEFAMMRRITEKTGRPLLFSLNQRHDRTTVWKELLAHSDQAAADGLSMRPVFPPRPIGILLGLSGSQNPFAGTPTYKSIAHLPVAERAAAMRDSIIREAILSEDPVAGSTFPLLTRLGYARMFAFAEDPPCYDPPRERSVEAIAAREGRTAPEVAYDVLTSDNGENFLFACVVNYADFTLDPVREMLSHPNTLVGLGDGGAHVGFISDASFSTYLLTYWGRDCPGEKFALEELVRRQTSDTARAAGLHDRGVIARGMKADVNLIDFDALAFNRPTMLHDLPAGGRRLLQGARGYFATIQSGAVTYRAGVATGALPGRLVRGERLAPSA